MRQRKTRAAIVKHKPADSRLDTIKKARDMLAACRRPEEMSDVLAAFHHSEEVKDIRDWALAVQEWNGRKKGAEAAANHAGAIAVEAAARLARMYFDTPKATGSAPGKRGGKRMSNTGQSFSRAEFCKEAETKKQDLGRWKPLALATPAARDDAVTRAAAAGRGVTTASVTLALRATSAADGYDGDEWYTPADVIDLVRQVLGTIDLDPASNEHAQETVRAAAFYTKAHNALTKPWKGRVFCNPPYSMPLIQQFTAKLIEEYDAHRTKAAVYLVNNCTDSTWCQSLLHRFPVCFTNGRIGFLNGGGQKFATRQGQAIFYLGTDETSFQAAFNSIGVVLMAT